MLTGGISLAVVLLNKHDVSVVIVWDQQNWKHENQLVGIEGTCDKSQE